MAERRRYTKAQKARAVGLAVVTSIEAAAETEGIPTRTLGYWMDRPEFAELRLRTRDHVAAEMWTAIQIGIQEIAKDIVGDAPLRDKVVAVGVLYDKHALLTGMATARTESRDLTGTISDADIIIALREAERSATAGRTAAPTPSEAEG
jgi:ribosomal protein S28E/S33